MNAFFIQWMIEYLINLLLLVHLCRTNSYLYSSLRLCFAVSKLDLTQLLVYAS
jgi:hypothetical protein